MVYAPQRSRLAVSIGALDRCPCRVRAATMWRTDQINSCLDGNAEPNTCLEETSPWFRHTEAGRGCTVDEG